MKYEGNNLDIRNDTVSETQCQTTCGMLTTGTPCVGYSFDTVNLLCYLKTSISYEDTNDTSQYFISGPPECPGTAAIDDDDYDVPDPSIEPESGQGPNIPLIVGASLGGVAAIALIAGAAFYFGRNKPSDEEDDELNPDYSAADGDMVYVRTKDFADAAVEPMQPSLSGVAEGEGGDEEDDF